jgi:hypothetical protein
MTIFGVIVNNKDPRTLHKCNGKPEVTSEDCTEKSVCEDKSIEPLEEGDYDSGSSSLNDEYVHTAVRVPSGEKCVFINIS